MKIKNEYIDGAIERVNQSNELLTHILPKLKALLDAEEAAGRKVLLQTGGLAKKLKGAFNAVLEENRFPFLRVFTDTRYNNISLDVSICVKDAEHTVSYIHRTIYLADCDNDGKITRVYPDIRSGGGVNDEIQQRENRQGIGRNGEARRGDREA